MIKYFSILRWFAHLNDSVKLSVTLIVIVGILIYFNVTQYAENIEKQINFEKKTAIKDSVIEVLHQDCNELLRLCNTKNDSLYERILRENTRQITALTNIQERLKQGTWKPK